MNISRKNKVTNKAFPFVVIFNNNKKFLLVCSFKPWIQEYRIKKIRLVGKVKFQGTTCLLKTIGTKMHLWNVYCLAADNGRQKEKDYFS